MMLSNHEFDELARLYARIHFGKKLSIEQQNRLREILVREHPPAQDMDRIELRRLAKMVVGFHALLHDAARNQRAKASAEA